MESHGLHLESDTTGHTVHQPYIVPTSGGDVPLDLGPLLGWRQDEELQEFLSDLRTAASGGPAVDAFLQLLTETEASLRVLATGSAAAAAAAAAAVPAAAAETEAAGFAARPSGGSPSTSTAAAAAAAAESMAFAAAGPTAAEPCPGPALAFETRRGAGAGAGAVGESGCKGRGGGRGADGGGCSGSDPWVGVVAGCSALLELCWEKLHLGYWKDVHLAWRNGYSLLCFLSPTLSLLRLRSSGTPGPDPDLISQGQGQGQEVLQRCLRQLDLGLMMGGPLWRHHTHRLVDSLHTAAAAAVGAGAAAEAEGPAAAAGAAGGPAAAAGAAGGPAAAAGAEAAATTGAEGEDTASADAGFAAAGRGGGPSRISEDGGGGDEGEGLDDRAAKRRRRCAPEPRGAGAAVVSEAVVSELGKEQLGRVAESEPGATDADTRGSREGFASGRGEESRGTRGRQCGDAAASAAAAGVRLPRGSLGGPPGSRVPAVEQPGLEEFLLSYMVPEQPVVVTGAMDHWPAIRLWSDLSYLERAAGGRTVPVEVGDHYLAEGWGQQLMTMRDFLRRHVMQQTQPPPPPQPQPQPHPQQQTEAPPPPPPPPLQQPEAAAPEAAAAAAPPPARPPPSGPAPAPQAPPSPPPPSPAAGEVPQVQVQAPPPPPAGPPPAAPVPAPVPVPAPAPVSAPRGYLAQHALFEQVPALRRDIATPDYCCLGEEGTLRAVNAWLGPEGTTTPLHTDPHHNMLAQVVGRKYVRLYDPALTQQLHPFPSGTVTSNSSQVDLDLDLESEPEADPELDLDPAPALREHEAAAAAEGPITAGGDGADGGGGRRRRNRFPGVAALPYQDVVLEPGYMLYIPPGWWHFVRALSTSFSVSFWWR
ncbi:hypothetical protein PLESTB_000587900 [Pleodorina starrii]|uniref:JmjC domain-containing protein n=1 Tax=Pleodorina starrii TaxID=330485 RepID=A0A9W6BIP3_9CHLO|nr:hypothetical protein PLESTM_000296900 [Pleodorina starrii]GLC52146.1 hypothetical protein PLESTB_000587900 [Pleodorina starrii]GLC72286.1 hypothetical protein PLESTF_001227800 [Pleodorina starrii]